MEQQLLNVYGQPLVSNVCDQELRELPKLDGISFAHVIMQAKSESLLHQHNRMSEIYVITKGRGVLQRGNRAYHVGRGDYLLIPPNTAHKLLNLGGSTLEHLVFALPPFMPEDVEVLDEEESDPQLVEYPYEHKIVQAQDGVDIIEFLKAEERNELGVSLALGTLSPISKSAKHCNTRSDEVYFIINGSGVIHLNDNRYQAPRGAVAYIPPGVPRAFGNSREDELEILCLCVPGFKEEDFVVLDD